ncbi:MAG TPA: MFS transporter [Anaerolineae bacterium]|nr:MFS transporter [Anaerolineae bacterium]HMR67072.1 MFS transporter [Anaerolineae bacterium]
MNTYSTNKSSRLIQATPFFYGWVIVAAGTLDVILMGPSQTFTVGVFIDSFIADLGISRANISLIYGVATLGGSLLLPLMGRLVDRYGASRMILVVALGLGLSVASVSLAHGVLTLLLAMLAIRFFGFGSTQLVINNAIAHWFIRQRGKVMGITGLSLAASLLIYPSLAEYLIDNLGWRAAWVLMGASVLVVMLPVSWLFFKDKPEQYGLLPDGDLPAAAGSNGLVSDENWTLAEARRTGAFWIFAAALSTMTMLLAGLVFHQLSLFEVRGLPRETAVSAFYAMAIASVVGNLGMGYLLDRYSARLLLSLTLFILAAAVVLVQVITTPLQGALFSGLVGLTSGSFRVIDSVVWAKYYGRTHLGSIKGATMLGVIGATALGPYPLGLSYDALGSYSYALNGLLVLPVAIGIVALFINRPQKPNSGRG